MPVVQIRASMSSGSPSRPDGYRPIAGHVWRLFRGPYAPSGVGSEGYRHAMAAAMRLDAAHRGFERVRLGIEAVRSAPNGSFEQQDAYFSMWGEAHLAVIALRRALAMVASLPGHPRIVPPLVAAKQNAVKELRDAFEHIDDRALGLAGLTKKPTAAAVSTFKTELVGGRKLRYGSWSLGVDQEATALCIAARRHVIRWFAR